MNELESPGFSRGEEVNTAATLLAVAAVMADYADHGTGRHVAVTRATIAERLNCHKNTVSNAWAVLRASGWAVEAQRGHGSPAMLDSSMLSIHPNTPKRASPGHHHSPFDALTPTTKVGGPPRYANLDRKQPPNPAEPTATARAR